MKWKPGHFIHNVCWDIISNTFASASKRVALTPGVLAILWPTAAKMLQFGMTSTWREFSQNRVEINEEEQQNKVHSIMPFINGQEYIRELIIISLTNA